MLRLAGFYCIASLAAIGALVLSGCRPVETYTTDGGVFEIDVPDDAANKVYDEEQLIAIPDGAARDPEDIDEISFSFGVTNETDAEITTAASVSAKAETHEANDEDEVLFADIVVAGGGEFGATTSSETIEEALLSGMESYTVEVEVALNQEVTDGGIIRVITNSSFKVEAGF